MRLGLKRKSVDLFIDQPVPFFGHVKFLGDGQAVTVDIKNIQNGFWLSPVVISKSQFQFINHLAMTSLFTHTPAGIDDPASLDILQ